MAWSDVVAISFDLGGTLVRDEPGPATRDIADLIGVEMAAMRAHLGRDAKRVRQPPAALARQIASAFERPDLHAALADLLERRRARCAQPRLFPRAEQVLAELRRRGYCIALLSNVLGAIAPHPDRHPLFALADVVLMSCDTGHVKPERKAFTQVEQALDIDPGQLAHVGDSLGADIDGALSTGWHAVHIDPNGTPFGPPGPDAPSDRFRSLPALTGLLALFPEAPPRPAGLDGGTKA